MTIAVVNIGQLVTLAGPPRPRVGAELRELGLIQDAALLIEEGRIEPLLHPTSNSCPKSRPTPL